MRVRDICIIMIAFTYGQSCQAFDPFTAIAVSSSVVKGMGAIFGGVDEATSSLGAIQDLYSEVNSDAQVSESGKRITEEVEKIESLYEEMEYSSEDIKSTGDELGSAKSLSETLRGITSLIKKGKSMRGMFGGLQKQSELAQVETKDIAREQLMVQYELLNQEKLSELKAIEKGLEEKVHQKRVTNDLNKDLQKQGARTIGTHGMLAFPKTEEVIEDGIKLAVKIRPYLLSLALVMVFFRVIFYQFSFSGPEEYAVILKEVFVCFLIMAIFPELIRASFYFTSMIASHIHVTDTPFFTRADAAREIRNMSLPGGGDTGSWKTAMLMFFQYLWSGLRYACFTIAAFLYKYVILILVVLTPIVIFMSEMFNFPIGWKIFFIAFISMNLWPVLWNLFGVLVEFSASHGSGVVKIFESAIAMGLQLVSPFFVYLFTKHAAGSSVGMAAGGMKMGATSAGTAIAAVVSPSTALAGVTYAGASKAGKMMFSPPKPSIDQNNNNTSSGGKGSGRIITPPKSYAGNTTYSNDCYVPLKGAKV